jgi:hypothetical protein
MPEVMKNLPADTPIDSIKAPRPVVRDLVATVTKATGIKPTRLQAVQFLLDHFKKCEGRRD